MADRLMTHRSEQRETQLDLDLEAPRGRDHGRSQRRERRQRAVRMVEVRPLSRSAMAPPLFGFTRDISASGMCIGLDESQRVGALFRIAVHDLDGKPARRCIARVAWIRPDHDGRIWHGLQQVRGERGEGSGRSQGRRPTIRL